MKSIAYVVYPPPHKGLPFLAVTLSPDGVMAAEQFDTEDEAVKYSAEMAKRRSFRGARH
jgi:hypothetical protein